LPPKALRGETTPDLWRHHTWERKITAAPSGRRASSARARPSPSRCRWGRG